MSLIKKNFTGETAHQHTIFKSAAHRRVALQVKKDFDTIANNYEPKVASAFIKACKSVRDSIDMKKLTKACAGHNVREAQKLVAGDKFQKALDGEFRHLIFEAYHAGAFVGAKQLTRGKIKKAFSPNLSITNPAAVDYLASALPELIKEINLEQQQAVQTILLNGINTGVPADEMAREIRNSVGLTADQASWVDNFRTQLETGELNGWTPIDERRLSATDQQMAQSEFDSPNSDPTVIDLLVDKYQFSLINKRAMDISVTEIHDASIAGQDDLWGDAVDAGYLDPATVTRHWGGTDDGRERDSHIQVPIDNPDGVGLDEDFDTEVGPVHAPGQSGEPSFDINCRCYVYLMFDESGGSGDGSDSGNMDLTDEEQALQDEQDALSEGR